MTGVLPDLTVLGKVIGGGLPAAAYGGRRTLMERVAPAGDVYQAGTLSGNPLAVAAGAGHARSCSTSRPTCAWRATTEALADGPARGGRRAPAADRDRARPAHPVLLRGARPRLRGRPGLRPRRVRRLVPGAARPRRLRAAVAVRGLVRLHRPRARAPRPHGRGRDGGVRGDLRDAAARELARRCATRAACWPPRSATSRRSAAARGPARRGPLPARGDPRGRAPALRRGRASWTPPTPTSRCWPATGSTRSAWSASPRSATSTRSARWPTSSPPRAQAHAEGRPELAEAAWADGAARVHRTGPAKPGATGTGQPGTPAYSHPQ